MKVISTLRRERCGSRRHEAGLRRSLRRAAGLLCWSLTLAGCVAPARASVSLLVEQPYGGFGAWNPTGHSALYFDHICAQTPTELRPCQPGELGVVISRYDGIEDHDWIAMPLVPYLYAVATPAEVPERASRLDVVRLRDLYRRDYLQALAPDTPAGGMPQGNWYELVGAAYDRTIYGFQVKTTPEQDAHLIALFNDRPNVQRYNGELRNCADFARLTLNRIYPHAVRRNFIADFGMTTPKSVAHGLTHYAHKHPETELVEFQIPQVKGDLPRSMNIEGVTESLLKRYGVPLVILSPQVTAAVLVAYVGGHGRFPMPKDAPVLNLETLQQQARGPLMAQMAPKAAPNASGEAKAAALPTPLLSSGGFDDSISSALPVAFVSSVDCVEDCPGVPSLP